MSLERRTPLRANPEKVRAWQDRSRKPLKSKKRRTPAERAVRERVFERDGHCQLVGHGDCFGPLTPHHRRKESDQGAYSEANLVSLCSFHNGQLEADADLARVGRRLGLVVRRGDDGWEQLGGEAS